jgi:hypothetical protein
MNYKQYDDDHKRFLNNVGKRYDLVEGYFEEAEDGQFLVTRNLTGTDIIFVTDQTYTILAENKFVGIKYALPLQHCGVLVLDYLDHVKADDDPVSYRGLMTSLPASRIIQCFKESVAPLLEQQGFVSHPREELQVNDIVIWAITPGWTSHMGIYLGDNKIIHHIANRYSSIDTIDITSDKLIGVYRYGG